MKRSLVETIIGGLVIVVAAVFLFFAYGQGNFDTRSGYQVNAKFLSIGGLTSGADVRIGGVKVGSVTALDLDPETFIAIVTVAIGEDIILPVDTVVEIKSDGLLGGRYVALVPGVESEVVPPGGELTNTRDVASIEDLLARAIFVIADDAAGDSGNPGVPGGDGSGLTLD